HRRRGSGRDSGGIAPIPQASTRPRTRGRRPTSLPPIPRGLPTPPAGRRPTYRLPLRFSCVRVLAVTLSGLGVSPLAGPPLALALPQRPVGGIRLSGFLTQVNTNAHQ